MERNHRWFYSQAVELMAFSTLYKYWKQLSSLLFHSNKENLLYFDKTSTYLVFLPNNKSILFEKNKRKVINKQNPAWKICQRNAKHLHFW